jgi:hypothetical protein
MGFFVCLSCAFEKRAPLTFWTHGRLNQRNMPQNMSDIRAADEFDSTTMFRWPTPTPGLAVSILYQSSRMREAQLPHAWRDVVFVKGCHKGFSATDGTTDGNGKLVAKHFVYGRVQDLREVSR